MPSSLIAPTTVERPPAPPAPATPYSLVFVLAYLGFHLVLGVAGHLAPMVATIHAGIVGATVVVLACLGRRLDRLVLITAYAALCDIYWRMTASRAPWEFSKYLLIIGSIAILARFARSWVRPLVPLAFLACLVPGIVMTLLSFGPSMSRGMLVDAGLGAVALGFGALAFRQLVLTESDAWNLGWVMLGPLSTAVAITTYATLTTAGITFSTESNFDVTGGYGPNQVSSAMGLAILICVLLAFQRRGPRYLMVLVAFGAWGTWATLLTFSRGGLYSLLIAACAMLLVGVTTRGARTRSVIVLVVGVVALGLIFSSVNDFSGNWLETRYTDKESGQSQTAGRSDLASEDLAMFAEHPIWGVGVGQSQLHHALSGRKGEVATHTEPSRLLADHGLFGLVALGLLGVMVVTAYRVRMSRWNAFLIVAAAAWSSSTMLHAATRLAAVSLLFAISQLRVEPDPLKPPRGPRGR